MGKKYVFLINNIWISVLEDTNIHRNICFMTFSIITRYIRFNSFSFHFWMQLEISYLQQST